MKKRLKQIFLFILFILGIGLVTLIAIPLLFKDEIVQAIKTVANDELSAVVDFEEVGLSFFHDFPNLSVDIQNLSVTGIEEFEGTVLYSAPRSIFNLDLKSIFKKDQIGTINTIELRDPTIQLIITKEGIENYNIAKSTKTSNAPEAYEIDLSAFEVVNADFLYRDESSNISTVLEGIQISGKASLRGDIYNFDYQGSINQSSIKSSGITYLNQVHTKLKGVAIMDLSNSKFEFESNELVLNDLDMRMSGWVQNKPSATLMDIEFESADNKFKKMWSLVPQAYTTNFPDAQIDGNMSINGYIRGTYDDQVTQLPSFEIDIKANNGTVSYPEAPESLQNIHADIKISSPGDLDQLQIDVPRLDFTLADNPVRGRFSVRNVQSNPAIDMALKGEIELEKLASVLGPDNTADLSGTIDCDVQVKGKQSDIQNRAYQNTLISGYLNIDDLKYSDANSPDLHLLSLKSNFSPSKLKIHSISGQLGRTDINAEAEVNNVISLLTPGQRVTGSVQWSSNLVDLNEWMTGAESEADTLKIPIELPTNFQFSVDANANTLLYSDYDMQDVKIKGTIDNGDLVIRQLSSQLGESDIYVSGRLNNTMNYLFGNETLSGMMNVRSSHLNLNTLMPSSSDQDNTQGERAPILVPKNVNVLVNAEIGSLLYDDINMSNLKGALAVAEQEARIENMTAQAFDGTFDLNGGYDSKNEEKPQFDINYTLKQFDFRKTFEKVNTFKILAPIAEFIQGNFNSQISMQGELGSNLLPDFTTLNADGFVQTFNGLLQGFKPLEILNQYFAESYLKSLKLTDTRNNFTVKDGMVTIEEFDKQIEDIQLKISGTHSLDQNINYLIKSKIPKEKLAKTGITDFVDEGLKSVNTQLNRLGFNINRGKFININFLITGSIKNPKVELQVVGMDGETNITEAVKEEIEEAVATVKDSIRTTVEAKVDSLENLAQEKRDEVVDSAAALANQKLDSLKANVKQEVDSLLKDKIGNTIPDSLKTQIDSILLKGGGKEVDKVKEILKDINPFKKKKKKSGINGLQE